MAASWLETLKTAQKTQLVQDGKRKIHFTFSSGVEMAEDYDMRTGLLLVRRWKRKKGGVLGQSKWEYEIGEELAPGAQSLESEGLVASASNPIFVRKDTKKAFVWRIRNLPYPLETYDVTVTDDAKFITIRTTNKKYYKKFDIPDMDRCQLTLDQQNLSVAHANNTLLVTYQKPSEILELESKVLDELQKTKVMKDGDLECNPS